MSENNTDSYTSGAERGPKAFECDNCGATTYEHGPCVECGLRPYEEPDRSLNAETAQEEQ